MAVCRNLVIRGISLCLKGFGGADHSTSILQTRRPGLRGRALRPHSEVTQRKSSKGGWGHWPWREQVVTVTLTQSDKQRRKQWAVWKVKPGPVSQTLAPQQPSSSTAVILRQMDWYHDCPKEYLLFLYTLRQKGTAGIKKGSWKPKPTTKQPQIPKLPGK